MFLKKTTEHILIAQVYVDDIVFGSTSKELADEFITAMQTKFEMSTVGELTFFRGLQIKEMKERTFLSQAKYANNL